MLRRMDASLPEINKHKKDPEDRKLREMTLVSISLGPHLICPLEIQAYIFGSSKRDVKHAERERRENYKHVLCFVRLIAPSCRERLYILDSPTLFRNRFRYL
ncbi:hypothetical protein CDAR_1141 [Caerostris darwini]|uniref:Uncharacterized protein n=1 Tax=Caerostris darwini TaxID=1538125 RepID=A0AAV4SMJ6_9ARAC|nr:hypothetical protein CDAR_951 [Caerostris darwini]GIY35310.1 hypothetical protein CDAR_1141 [Caerostris darwini]